MSHGKNNHKENNPNIHTSYNLRNYVKKGTIKENAIDELYNVTTKKLGEKYQNRLSLLLYNGGKVKNYFDKRANLDKVIYEYKEDEDKLYITLADFKKKNNSNSLKNIGNNKNNSSFQNYTENASKFLTSDTNHYNYSKNNNSNDNIINGKKNKLKIRDIYDKFKEERLNIEIKKLLLNEDKPMPKNLEREIFEKLNLEYNFMKEDKKYSKNNLKLYGNKSIISKYDSLIPKNNKNINYVSYIKKKTDELNKIKLKRKKNYLSPIFFLGKTNDKFIHHISYASHEKLKIEKNDKDINNIKKENIKFLKIMGKDVNELHEINSNNKNIMSES